MESAIIEHLIDNIFSVLENEASLLRGVHDAVDDIKKELKSMHDFLVDTNKRGVRSEGEKNWVANVRNMVYDVEDVIDEFMYHIRRQQLRGRFASQTIYFPQNLRVRQQTATRLQKINKEIRAIPEMKERYHVDCSEGQSSGDQWVRRGESSLCVTEDELVGIETKRLLLMGWLMGGESQLTVISIVGMGGSGKTSLAANTFNNVKKHFDCYAWITVSLAYKNEIDDILRSMTMQFYDSKNEVTPTGLSSMDYKGLLRTLMCYIKDKTFLLVLDDVWDTNFLDDMKVPLPVTHNGSRILLTTRNEDVARYPFGGKSDWHRIQPLKEEEAMELFCKKAFSSSPNRTCPLQHQSFVQGLVKKCGGLPLAITALGSLMCMKNLSQWEEISSNLDFSLSENPKLGVPKSILLLSFNDLPYHLKPCFLYCSLFPKNHEIQSRRLMKLWMAEGFVKQVRGFTQEEVAESYLVQLICRNLLEVVRWNGFGRPKRCKMHDVMRELALSISEAENFGVVHDGGEEMRECKARRISIQITDSELQSFMGISKLRSFLVFNKLKTLPFGSKMLRVLDLEDAPIDELSDELFNLFNLRYLNLRGTLVKELPKSIKRLLNLQTLDIGNTKIETLPREVGKLENLRHLILHHFTKNWFNFKFVTGTRTPSNISRLKNLQVLSYLEANSDLIRQIQSMTQLTTIGISNVKEVDNLDLCDSIQRMKLLRFLSIMVADEEETLQLDALSSPPPNLQKLVLIGKLNKLPQWVCSLERLTELCLHWSRLQEDIVPSIANLPNLGRLELTNAYLGRRLIFGAGFLKLTALMIVNLPQLNEVTIERGVMPDLKLLYIVNCMELNTVPRGIEYLNLQVLFSGIPSVELRNSVNFANVQHMQIIYRCNSSNDLPRDVSSDRQSLPYVLGSSHFEMDSFYGLD